MQTRDAAPPSKRAGHGGKRTGAGRKRSEANRKDPRHVRREVLSWRHPVHVILVTRADVPSLRQREVYDVIRRLMWRYVERGDFRIVHVSLQRNHIHLIVEARNERSLQWGMASFAIRVARTLNKLFGRRGKLFAHRYNAKQIRTRDYARNAIAYVLNNWRRHKEDENGGEYERWLAFDPYSSARTFDGWARNKRRRGDVIDPAFSPLPVSRPRTSLLRIDWTWYGLVDPYETSRRYFLPRRTRGSVSAAPPRAPARRGGSPRAPRARPPATHPASRASA